MALTEIHVGKVFATEVFDQSRFQCLGVECIEAVAIIGTLCAVGNDTLVAETESTDDIFWNGNLLDLASLGNITEEIDAVLIFGSKIEIAVSNRPFMRADAWVEVLGERCDTCIAMVGTYAALWQRSKVEEVEFIFVHAWSLSFSNILANAAETFRRTCHSHSLAIWRERSRADESIADDERVELHGSEVETEERVEINWAHLCRIIDRL